MNIPNNADALARVYAASLGRYPGLTEDDDIMVIKQAEEMANDSAAEAVRDFVNLMNTLEAEEAERVGASKA
jgi:hypothetical protein